MSEKKKTVYFKRSKYRSGDFTENDLPLTRRRQFLDILKNDWKTLLLLGVILFFVSIPYLTIDFVHWFIVLIASITPSMSRFRFWKA